MSQILRLLGFVGLTTLAALLACNSSSTSPTSPLSTSPMSGVSSGRISGTFVSGTGVSSLTAHRQTAFGITVTVQQNAGISAEVRSDGTFTLEHVPMGTVVLVFTRDGTHLGEVTIQGVTASDEVRVTLKLRANDTVVLVDVRRASDDNTNDDTDSELELELDPSKFCPEWATGGRPEDDPPFATIKGDSVGDIVLASIMLVGPGGSVPPTPSAVRKSDRIEAIFDKADAISVVSGVQVGQRVTVRITGKFNDGTSWKLETSIRVKCDDENSDDNSSGS